MRKLPITYNIVVDGDKEQFCSEHCPMLELFDVGLGLYTCRNQDVMGTIVQFDANDRLKRHQHCMELYK